MSSKRNEEVVDAIASVISSKNHSTVLPVVFLGTSVTAVLTHLRVEGRVRTGQNHSDTKKQPKSKKIKLLMRSHFFLI